MSSFAFYVLRDAKYLAVTSEAAGSIGPVGVESVFK